MNESGIKRTTHVTYAPRPERDGQEYRGHRGKVVYRTTDGFYRIKWDTPNPDPTLFNLERVFSPDDLIFEPDDLTPDVEKKIFNILVAVQPDITGYQHRENQELAIVLPTGEEMETSEFDYQSLTRRVMSAIEDYLSDPPAESFSYSIFSAGPPF